MTLLETINADLKAAMIARDADTKTTLQGLKAAIRYVEIDGKTELDDAGIQKLLMKEAKKRKESAELFRKGGNEESAAKEDAELALIEAYLPEAASEEDVVAAVAEAIQATGASSMQDMGKVMGMVKGKLGDTVDGSLVAKIVKEKLG